MDDHTKERILKIIKNLKVEKTKAFKKNMIHLKVGSFYQTTDDDVFMLLNLVVKKKYNSDKYNTIKYKY